MTAVWHSLPLPQWWPPAARRAFLGVTKAFQEEEGDAKALVQDVLAQPGREPSVIAAALVLADLANQGWLIRVQSHHEVLVQPPPEEVGAREEKRRVQRQELLKRDEQLSIPSVRRFISEMERPREFNGSFVSIFSLMRDGAELAAALRKERSAHHQNAAVLRLVIDPYLQLVRNGERCAHTGLKLTDIWRYFRHTWSNQHTSTPGRSMLVLVRDRAVAHHPVIGIVALASAVVQIAERDNWIGWQPQRFLENMAARPSARMARWLVGRLAATLTEIYLDDLIEDGLYWPALWDHPTDEAIVRLAKESDTRRRDHHRFVRRAEFKDFDRDGDPWAERATSDLFRSKRCSVLVDLLRARRALAPFLCPNPTAAGLREALRNPAAKSAIVSILRRAKAEAVGTEIADLTVCGAVAPYNALLGGKLVSMLAVSPTIVRAYHARYASYAGEIASSLAGCPVHRRSNLVFIGTTSLYGSGSSQYNRVRIPDHVLGGNQAIEFRRLGRSKSFGTSHLSAATVKALVTLTEHHHMGARVNSIFGEGVNPKLRKIREGLDLLGWPSDELLQHRRHRIVYGVSLVTELLPYLLGERRRPQYVFPRNLKDDVERITDWWFERWLVGRVAREPVLEEVARHTLQRPVSHGARVTLPPDPG